MNPVNNFPNEGPPKTELFLETYPNAIYKLAEIRYPHDLPGHQPSTYVTYKIRDKLAKALVDGGATRSFIDSLGYQLIKDLNLGLITKKGAVKIANGEIMLSSQEILLPIELKIKIRASPYA